MILSKSGIGNKSVLSIPKALWNRADDVTTAFDRFAGIFCPQPQKESLLSFMIQVRGDFGSFQKQKYEIILRLYLSD